MSNEILYKFGRNYNVPIALRSHMWHRHKDDNGVNYYTISSTLQSWFKQTLNYEYSYVYIRKADKVGADGIKFIFQNKADMIFFKMSWH